MTILLPLILLLAPIKVEHGRFNITKDGKKIGAEEFSIAMQGKNYTVDGKVTIGEVTISSRMELDDKLAPVSYEASSPEGKMRVTISSPISELQAIVGDETSSADFRFPEGGIILDNNLFHHYLILLYRVQTGQTNFPVFVPQERSAGTATVRATGPGAYELQLGDLKMEATTDHEGKLIKLTVPSANVVVER